MSGKYFFISRAGEDSVAAQRIAEILEEAGHRVFIQDWDTLPGHSFPDKITGALRDCSHVIAVESAAYNAKAFTQAEFFNAWTRDPLGRERHMIPIKVGDCERHPLLRHFVEIDLVGRTAPEQRRSKTRRRGSGAHLAQRIGRASSVLSESSSRCSRATNSGTGPNRAMRRPSRKPGA